MKSILPKPIHGWRAFGGEVGVIVLGVLIAIGVQKVAESVNDARRVSNAEENIRVEIADNLGDLSKRADIQRCLTSRLEEIAHHLQQAEASPDSPPPTWIGRPQVWNMSSFRWNTASQGGGSSLMSAEEQATYADIYGSFIQVEIAQAIEQDAWMKLRAMEGQQHLSDTILSEMRVALSQARYSNWRIHLSAEQALEEAGKLGILPVRNASFIGSQSVCVAMDMPRSEALRKLGSPFGEP
jgi:hypothetical protein